MVPMLSWKAELKVVKRLVFEAVLGWLKVLAKTI